MKYVTSILRSLICFFSRKKKKMPKSLNNIEKYLDLVEGLLIKFKGVVKSDNLKKDKFYSILFLCKFYEVIYDINVLIQANRYNSIPILFRTTLEISFDIKNIKNSEDYLDKLAYTAAKKEISRLKSLTIITEYSANKGIQNQIEIYENIVSKIPVDSQKTVQIIDKMRNVDSSNLLYRVVYSKLCKETHSNMIELEKHFFKLKDSQITFIYDVSTTDLDKEKFIDAINLTILDTIIAAAQINNIDTSEYENILSEFSYK